MKKTLLLSTKTGCSKWVFDIPIMVFPRETIQPDDVCSRVRYYVLEGDKQQAVEGFEDSLRILDMGNCYHFDTHASQALEGSCLRRQR